MKLILYKIITSMILVIIVLSLFSTSNSKKRRRVKSKVHLKSKTKDANFKIYCDENIKKAFIFNNAETSTNKDCSTIKFTPFQFSETNCIKKEYSTLEELTAPKESEIGIKKVLNQIPIETAHEMLLVSKCTKPRDIIGDYSESRLTTAVELGINIKMTKETTENATQFYDIKDFVVNHIQLQAYVLYFSDIGNITLQDICKQLSLGPGYAGNEIDCSKELILKEISLNVRSFAIGKHELLGLCFQTGPSSDYYHFVIHRGAKKNHFVTLIKVLYYGKNKKCKHPSEINSKTSEKAKKVFDDTSAINLSLIVEDIKKYGSNNSFYNIAGSNCQHFATGFYNKYTGERVSTTNNNIWGTKPVLQKKRSRREKRKDVKDKSTEPETCEAEVDP